MSHAECPRPCDARITPASRGWTSPEKRSPEPTNARAHPVGVRRTCTTPSRSRDTLEPHDAPSPNDAPAVAQRRGEVHPRPLGAQSLRLPLNFLIDTLLPSRASTCTLVAAVLLLLDQAAAHATNRDRLPPLHRSPLAVARLARDSGAWNGDRTLFSAIRASHPRSTRLASRHSCGLSRRTGRTLPVVVFLA